MPIRFDHPELLALLLLAGPIVWLGMRNLQALDGLRKWVAIGLRLAVLLCLVMMLAGLEAVRWHRELTVIALMDQSESVRRFVKPPVMLDDDSGNGWGGAVNGVGNTEGQVGGAEQWMKRYLQVAGRGRQVNDLLGVVTFDGRPTVRALPSTMAEIDTASLVEPVDGSDVASAIRSSLAVFSAESSRRIVLFSDGNDTAGSQQAIEEAVREARAAGVRIDVVPMAYKIDNEVIVEGLYAPAEASKGQTIAIRAVLSATRPTAGQLHLLRDGMVVDLNGDGPGQGVAVDPGQWSIGRESVRGLDGDEKVSGIAADRYVAVKRIELPTDVGGATKFEAVFQADKFADTVAVNNRAEAFTMVRGQGRVLLVDTLGPGSGEILPDALREHGIELEVVPGHAFPTDFVTLSRYDAVILQNVPADAIAPRQQRMLARYVNDMGGGLVMVGGPDSFGAGGWTNSPVDQILPVHCEIPSQTVLPSGALVLVIDRSGSMGSPVGQTPYTQQEVASQAAVLALSTLYPDDLVGVVAFDQSAKWVVTLQRNKNPEKVAELVKSITPGGGTNIFPGLVEAHNALSRVPVEDAAIKHVILLTDGQSNEGDYFKIVGQMVKNGITLSTIGVGNSHNVQLLDSLAKMAGGHFYPVSNPNDLPQVFIKEAKTIRKNLIKEKRFEPKLRGSASPIMNGMSQPPLLAGLVLTEARRDPRVYLPMVGEEGEPLFAHWQVGLGRTAAFTSDATNRWAKDWMAWGGYSDFWARTVRHVSRTTGGAGLDLVTAIERGRLKIRLDATGVGEDDDKASEAGLVSSRNNGEGGIFLNALQTTATVVNPEGEMEQVVLTQTGPGVYEAEMPVASTGSYMVNVFAKSADGQPQAVFGGVTQAPGPELRSFTSNRALLERIAALGGGEVLDPSRPTQANLFSRESVTPTRAVRPMWRELMVGLFVLLLLDVACRRVAWEPAAIGRWLQLRFGRLRSARDAEQATQTLAALKEARTRGKAQAKDDVIKGKGAAVEAGPARTRKFEPARGFKASGDLASAVGGATKTDAVRVVEDVSEKAAVNEGPMTSRLLDAKRRARERLSEGDEDGA